MILALDASYRLATVALLENSGELSVHAQSESKGHSQTLLTLINNLLVQNGISLCDIEKVVFANGPGGFTSLRVALATLQGLFWPGDIPCLAVSSLALRMSSAKTFTLPEVIWAQRAGEGQFYVALRQEGIFQESLMDSKSLHYLVSEKLQNSVLCGEAFANTEQSWQSRILTTADEVDPQAFCRLLLLGGGQCARLSDLGINYLRAPVG